MRFRQCAPILAMALLCPLNQSFAQDLIDEPAPAHIAVVDGSTSLTREGERDAADTGMPVVPGDVLRTDRGRLELLFPDGSVVDLDEYSTLELLSPSLMRLSEGRLRVVVFGVNDPRNATRITIDTPLASADLLGPGEYRLSLGGSAAGLQTALDVVRGNARLSNERGSTSLRAGEQSLAMDASAPTYARFFNSARYDVFDQWATAVRDDRTRGGLSTQYLPADLRMYGSALDRNGSWAYEGGYGYVWYPTVTADWRPYDDGYWEPIPRYGWTWIGAGVWSWPTHHYGRWGYQRSRWFWIPDRHWAPAWVSWGAATDYVSWCPLGYDNRPVFALSISSGDRWGGGGWSFIDREHFGRPRWNVRQYAVRSFPSNTRFVQQAMPPIPARRGPERRVAGAPQGGRDVNGSAGYAVPRTGPRNERPGAAPQRDRADSGRDGVIRGADRASQNGSIRDNGSAQRPGEYAVPRDRARDAGQYRNPVEPGSSSRPLRDNRGQQGTAEPAQPPSSFSPPAPVAPATPYRARPRGGDGDNAPPPSSFEPRRPVEPVNPGPRGRSRDQSAPPPSSFEPARPTPPVNGGQSRSSASPPPERPSRSEGRAEPRSAPRGDRPTRDQGAASGQDQGSNGDSGGGRARRR